MNSNSSLPEKNGVPLLYPDDDDDDDNYKDRQQDKCEDKKTC